MKRLLAVLVLVCTLITLCSCGDNKKAAELSEQITDSLSVADKELKNFGNDIVAAQDILMKDDWSFVDFEKLDIGYKNFVAGLVALSNQDSFYEEYQFDDDEKTAMFWLFTYVLGADESPHQRQAIAAIAVCSAYETSGKNAIIQAALGAAKDGLAEMGKYDKYENLSALEDYYTAAKTFYEVCINASDYDEESVREHIDKYSDIALTCQNMLQKGNK